MPDKQHPAPVGRAFIIRFKDGSKFSVNTPPESTLHMHVQAATADDIPNCMAARFIEGDGDDVSGDDIKSAGLWYVYQPNPYPHRSLTPTIEE